MTKMQALVKLNVWNQYLSHTLDDGHTIENAMSDKFEMGSSFPWEASPEGHGFWNQTDLNARKLIKETNGNT